jgi:Fe-S oxidoreductase
LSEWLVTKIDRIKQYQFNLEGAFTLLTHCTELAMLPNSVQHWQHIFTAFGLKLNHQATGCCGMAGLYGHESSNYQNSQKIYQLSWQKIINNTYKTNKLVATGYSCRSQVKRFANKTLPHPVEVLINKL